MALRVFLLSLLAILAIAPSTHGGLINIARNVVESGKERIDRETNPFGNLSSKSLPFILHKGWKNEIDAVYNVIAKEISFHHVEVNFVKLIAVEEHSSDNVDLEIRITL